MARIYVDPSAPRAWGSGGDYRPRPPEASSSRCGPGAAPLVRYAAHADIEAMIGLLGELFAIEEDFSFDPEAQRRGLGLMLDQPDCRCVFVAEAMGMVAGMATGQIVISTAEGAASVWVEDVVVAAAHRGKGLGRALMTAVSRWAAMRGATRMQLVADMDNAQAFRFYERLGWETTNLAVLRKTRAK